MALFLAVLLGLVQGLTEFLPVSSSGHLRLMAAAFGVDEPQTLFDVCVHGGTLGAVIAVYRGEVSSMLHGVLRPSWSNPGFKLGILVIVGTVPAAVIGLTLGDWLETHLGSVLFVGIFLVVNGAILMASKGRGTEGRSLAELTLRDALIVGLCQAIALCRGISRSGTTITAALGIGVQREAAATFSFLLSIPAIGGALLLKTGEALQQGGVNIAPLVLGAFTALVSGYFALIFLVRMVNRGALHHFAWYCWAVGAVAIVSALR